MNPFRLRALAVWTSLAMLAACQHEASSVSAEQQGGTGKQEPAATASHAWPSGLRVIGNGYPRSGDACRRIGESASTANFLDDSADLVGCHSSADAARFGGRIVGVVGGITLVSVPSHNPAFAGNGDNAGDAKVPGTDFHATAEIRCSGYRKHPAGRCPAGVKRNIEGGLTVIDITWPAGDSRALYFDAAGRFAGANTNQADGSAAFQPKAERQGDTVVVTIGPERYEFAAVFVTGD